MTERQEQATKALRRAWREFCDKVNRMGGVELTTSVDERERNGDAAVVEFYGRVRIDE